MPPKIQSINQSIAYPFVGFETDTHITIFLVSVAPLLKSMAPQSKAIYTHTHTNLPQVSPAVPVRDWTLSIRSPNEAQPGKRMQPNQPCHYTHRHHCLCFQLGFSLAQHFVCVSEPITCTGCRA